MPPPPTLPDELLEEIFLRLPPEEPAWFARASLASKLWLACLSAPRFHARYRDFHSAPPMLGFFYRRPESCNLEKETLPLFLSTTRFAAHISDEQGWRSYGCDALDCRHGRVVLGDKLGVPTMKLTVSDPMTGCWWDVGAPMFLADSYGAATVCAVAGCDHRACHDDGPFLVVFVGLDKNLHGGTVASVWVSSPEKTGECSEPSSDFLLGEWGAACSGVHIGADPYIEPTCPVLVGDALHFMLVYVGDDDRAAILMVMDDGSLGFAYVHRLTLYVWSRRLVSDGVASWIGCKVINLKELLLILNPENRLTLIGSLEGCDIIFVSTDLGIYQINLKTLQ